MSSALQDFHENGGHAATFTPEQIVFIIRHGIVAFLELQIRSGIFIAIGSVSALSRTPCSHHQLIGQWHHEAATLFPQYDAQRIALPYSDEDRLSEASFAEKQLFICRSSILPFLCTAALQPQLGGYELPSAFEGRQLRRIGAAARGKMEVLGVAMHAGGQQDLAFNIGTVKGPADRTFSMGNVPSQGHNSWMTPVAWVERPTPMEAGIQMYWTHYRGRIQEGQEAFMGEGGILRGKGYDVNAIRASIAWSVACIQRSIERGERVHAAW